MPSGRRDVGRWTARCGVGPRIAVRELDAVVRPGLYGAGGLAWWCGAVVRDGLMGEGGAVV